jgi:hypothetical protein
MNAMEYIEERSRMCESFGSKCKGCPANFDNMFCCGVAAISKLDAKEQVAIVEKWSKEHPHKTRQDVFLEQCPEAPVDQYGYVMVCPKPFSDDFRNKYGNCEGRKCPDCRREFWMEEVKEDK